MSRSKSLFTVACVLAIPLLAGCGNACFKLADQICSCQPDDATRANCQARARDQAQIFSVTAADEALCQQKLDSNACNCPNLTTPEGRVACGTGYSVAPPDPDLSPR